MTVAMSAAFAESMAAARTGATSGAVRSALAGRLSPRPSRAATIIDERRSKGTSGGGDLMVGVPNPRQSTDAACIMQPKTRLSDLDLHDGLPRAKCFEADS